MGRMTYYSPILLGFVVVLMLNPTIRENAPHMSSSLIWPFVIAIGLLAGLACQLVMVGAQGIFAQVLPVPGGRSIRGGGAYWGGWCIIKAIIHGCIALLLGFDELKVAASVFLGLAIASAATAIAIYGWSWPTAIRDFADE